MTVVTFDDDRAREWLIKKEDDHVRETGRERIDVRAEIARHIGISPGTIENIRRGRFKSLKTAVRDAIQAFAVRGIEAEMVRLHNVLEVARQCGESPGSDAIFAAEAALKNARQVLRGKL
jgi:hypothetical protein